MRHTDMQQRTGRKPEAKKKNNFQINSNNKNDSIKCVIRERILMSSLCARRSFINLYKRIQLFRYHHSR